MSGALITRWRPLVAVLTITGVLVATAGCGKAKYSYVTNADEQTYYKVPSSYVEVTEDKGLLDDFYFRFIGVDPDSELANLYRSARWSKFFDASATPSVGHMVSERATRSPVIYSIVQHVPTELQAALSFDFLRDFLWPPVTERRRAAYMDVLQEDLQTGMERVPPLGGFELLSEAVLTPSEGLHGVRVIYNWKVADGSVNTFDLSAYTNNDATIVYALMIRCELQCYHARAAEINDIATSFTVRSKAA